MKWSGEGASHVHSRAWSVPQGLGPLFVSSVFVLGKFSSHSVLYLLGGGCFLPRSPSQYHRHCVVLKKEMLVEGYVFVNIVKMLANER